MYLHNLEKKKINNLKGERGKKPFTSGISAIFHLDEKIKMKNKITKRNLPMAVQHLSEIIHTYWNHHWLWSSSQEITDSESQSPWRIYILDLSCFKSFPAKNLYRRICTRICCLSCMNMAINLHLMLSWITSMIYWVLKWIYPTLVVLYCIFPSVTEDLHFNGGLYSHLYKDHYSIN